MCDQKRVPTIARSHSCTHPHHLMPGGPPPFLCNGPTLPPSLQLAAAQEDLDAATLRHHILVSDLHCQVHPPAPPLAGGPQIFLGPPGKLLVECFD